MTGSVLAIVGLSALLHALWNVLLKTTGDPLRTSGRLLVAGTMVYVPLALVFWWAVGRPALTPEAFALGVLSGVLQTAYFIFLSAGYRRGDLSVVYPIARGSAPLFAVVAGVVILGERLGIAGWLGVLALLGAVVAIQRPWKIAMRRGRDRRTDAAIGFALLTGVTIASYSAVDRVGAQLAAPWLYAAVFFPVSALALTAWIRFVDTPLSRGRPGPPPAPWRRAAAVGQVSLVAYLLIVFAFSMAPLTVVAPLRESAVVLVSGWGSIRLGEASGRRERVSRIGAAVLVVVGVALLAIDSGS